MNILDENIGVSQRQQLAFWKIHFRQIGREIGRPGMDDREEIIPLLHTLRRPVFFTRDHDFYYPWLRHSGYCLVWLDVQPDQTALFIRRFLRHPLFRTQTLRMGKVVHIHEHGITSWRVGTGRAQKIAW